MNFTAIYSLIGLEACIVPPVDRESQCAKSHGALPNTELRSQGAEVEADSEPNHLGGDAARTRDDVERQDHSGQSANMLRFCDFVLIPKARLLLRCDRPVDIGSRAFDLLLVLAERRGELVSKQTIIRFVWPSTRVEESNLRFQMVLLRKVLGTERHLIKTIPGRGYLLAMDAPQTRSAGTGSR